MMTDLTFSVGPWLAWLAYVGAQPGSGGSGGGGAAQGFTIRSEAVKLPRKLAAGSNRPGRGDLYQDD